MEIFCSDALNTAQIPLKCCRNIIPYTDPGPWRSEEKTLDECNNQSTALNKYFKGLKIKNNQV